MKQVFLNNLKKLLSPATWIEFVKALRRDIPAMIKGIYMTVSYFILLVTFLFSKVYGFFMKIPVLGIPFTFIHSFWDRGGLHKVYEAFVNDIEKTRLTKLKRSYLISLAYKNLMVKKTRSFITILGMSVGVGIIVLLLSLGYGLERLIISRVAGLEELKMIDVTTGENTSLRLNNDVTKRLKKIPRVDQVVPFISLVGRVNYNKANTDTLVYAVPKEYLQVNQIKLMKGKYFASNTILQQEETGEVAGAESAIESAVWGDEIRDVDFNINPDVASLAWDNCSGQAKLVGYTFRLEGGYNGKELWGGEYAPFEDRGRAGFDAGRGVYLGLWVKGQMPLYDKNEAGIYVPQLDDLGRHRWSTVCVHSSDVQLETKPVFAEVLGEATESASVDTATDSAAVEETTGFATYEAVVATTEAGIEVVQLQASDSAATAKKKTGTLQIDVPLSGETIVSTGFLRLLNIGDNNAVGKKFKVSFIVVKNLMPEIEGRVLTNQIEYTIKGVIEDLETQYMYIPFADAQKIGIQNFSQVKVVFTDKERMAKARKEIETMGFKTNSAADTVSQIESLFANLRVLLGLLGMVALGVASLGMFNTLTVSLLERTREIGGMKTMGVVSDEIQDLFLAEAMIMGLGGGVGGLILGELIGRSISLGISFVAIVNGEGYLSLTYVPPFLVFFILLSSFIVGMITGFYPAQRAKKISALNALRYE